MINDMGVEIKSFEAIDEGTYDFVIHGVVGLGLREIPAFQGQEKPPAVQAKVIFELPELQREDGQSQMLTYKLTLSTSEKSNCFKFFKLIHGDKVSKATISQFLTSEGLRGLLGKTGTVGVKHWNKDGRNIATVDREGFARLHPKVKPPEATRPAFFFNPLNPDMEVFKNTLTFWTKKEVMSALNSDKFPAELHEAWAKAQEDEENRKNNKEQAKSEKQEDTSAIE